MPSQGGSSESEPESSRVYPVTLSPVARPAAAVPTPSDISSPPMSVSHATRLIDAGGCLGSRLSALPTGKAWGSLSHLDGRECACPALPGTGVCRHR